jgi:hypothetical protein
MSSTIIRVRALLRDDVGAGYPREYVLARVHGRQAAMAQQRHTLNAPAASDEQIWDSFLGELAWLFRQMNASQRLEYSPLFAMFEMKTIVLCLRNAAVERPGPRRQLLERSLLSPEIQNVLRSPGPIGGVIGGLGNSLESLSAAFADLDGRYFESGLKGLEDALMRFFLESIRNARLAPAVRDFVTRFTDLRNLMALYKHLRWELKGPVALIAGGSLGAAALKQIVTTEDRDALDALVFAQTGQRVTAANEISLETALLSSLARELSRASRRCGGGWLIAQHLWSSYVQARNLAVRHHATGVDRATVERELIA